MQWLWAMWAVMMRRKKSCLGCGQMLVAVPAGGGWAHLSPALSVSLLCCEGSDRWSPKVLVLSPLCFFRLSSSPLAWPDGTMPGEHGGPAGPQTLHSHKGQLLTERGRPVASLSHKHSAASLWMWAPTASALGWVKTFLHSGKCRLKVSQQSLLSNYQDWELRVN